eukprot:10994576-Alexandrium_andersonii.AAC.1
MGWLGRVPKIRLTLATRALSTRALPTSSGASLSVVRSKASPGGSFAQRCTRLEMLLSGPGH